MIPAQQHCKKMPNSGEITHVDQFKQNTSKAHNRKSIHSFVYRDQKAKKRFRLSNTAKMCQILAKLHTWTSSSYTRPSTPPNRKLGQKIAAWDQIYMKFCRHIADLNRNWDIIISHVLCFKSYSSVNISLIKKMSYSVCSK